MSDFPQIRRQFSQAHGYLDSASTSLTPNVVIDEMTRYYKEYRANVHRGMYKESECATREYELTRKKAAALVNADPSEIIFTPSATHASNMLIRSLEEGGVLPVEGNIVSTVYEHHASIVPLRELARRKGYALHIAPLEDTEGAMERSINGHTVIVAMTLASNVTGKILDVARVSQHAGLLIVDATAAVGHIPVDVKALGCDALYFSGHKMFGPTGVGVLWVRGELLAKLRPSVYGGHMVSSVSDAEITWADIPERFEPGTPNIAGVIGLGKAIDYLALIGIDHMRTYIDRLVDYAILQLSAIPGVHVFAAPAGQNVGNVAFTVDGIHPHDISEILGRSDVKVRGGHHCAMPLHTALGVAGTVRASVHAYTAKEDIDMLIAGIKNAQQIFNK